MLEALLAKRSGPPASEAPRLSVTVHHPTMRAERSPPQALDWIRRRVPFRAMTYTTQVKSRLIALRSESNTCPKMQLAGLND